jgi:hypothetical protein
MKHRFTAPIVAAVLVLALAAFTGSALAGDGHGGDNGKAAKQDTSAQAQPTNSDKQSSNSDKHSNSDKQSSNSDKQSSTSAGQPATGGDNSNGVKPSNSTKHDTYAKASSDQTKQYGNGKTAGQIATQAGHGDATLHGPGNSQPHKTAACPGGHEVDVHALKHKNSKCGTSSSETSKQVEVKKSEKVDVEKSKKTDVDVEKSKTEEKTTESHGVAESAHAHVTICHATGSSSNPYVRISPSASGVFHGHLGHQDGRDIVPPFTWKGQTHSENWDANGMAIYNAGCSAPATAQAQGVQGAEATQTQTCGTTTQTVTEQVLVGVNHKTGNGKFVLIHPSTHSAHYTGKHRDDIPVYETVTKTITVPATNCSAQSQSQSTVTPSSSASAPAAGTVAPATAAAPAAASAPATASAPAAAAPAAAAPAAAGGVKGAVVALKPTKTKPAGGVLGTTTRLGGKVAATRLPFTGLPLWIFALVAAGLIGAGLTMRRAAANRI